MDKLTAADAGCWIDGHHGQYAVPMMLRIATERGWGGLTNEEREYVDRWVNGHAGLDGAEDDYMAAMEEALMDAVDEAEAWLNENIAPEGFAFGWCDGEFFLQSDEQWSEE